MNKIKVLIIDDSKLMQSILIKALSTDDSIEVVGAAENPNIARRMIKELKPDVLTLDIEMPEMNGITFIEKLMKLHPMPVIMFSSLTHANSMATLEALELGAFDFLPKPLNPSEYVTFAPELINKIKQAARSKHRSIMKISQDKLVKVSAKLINKFSPNLILIGSSTGGVEALCVVLKNIKGSMPPIVVVQHLPGNFIDSLEEYLNKVTSAKISIAKSNTKLEPNTIYIAPPYTQLGITRLGSQMVFETSSKEPLGGHLPAVDYLFSSVARFNSTKTLAILLTGMGKDGAQGMLELKQNGAVTIAQDQETSVVWGMPRSAVELNAVDQVLPIHQIPLFMNEVTKREVGSSYV